MKYFLLIFTTILSLSVFGQLRPHIQLIASSKELSTIDQFGKGKRKQDYRVIVDSTDVIPRGFVSVIRPRSTTLVFTIDTTFFNADSISVFNETREQEIPAFFQGNRLRFEVESFSSDQVIQLFHKRKAIYRLDVFSMLAREEKIRIVPLLKIKDIQADSIQKELNRVYRPAGIHFSVSVQKPFLLGNFPADRLLRNPSEANERYSQEMRYLRNAYLKQHPELKNVHLVFIVPGFKNEKLTVFGVKEKTMMFAAFSNNSQLAEDLAKQLLQNPENDTREGDYSIGFAKWKERNNEQVVYSYFDDYEDIASTTGLVAFYFWKEDALGNIELPEKGTNDPLAFITRPYKRNTFSYHLRLDDFWMKTIFSVKSIPFNLLHILTFIGVTWLVFFGGIRLRRWIRAKWRLKRIFRFLSLFLIAGSFIFFNYIGFLTVNLAYSLYEVRSGTIDEFESRSIKNVEIAIQSNFHPRKLQEKHLGSELLVEVGNDIELRQRGQVIYFEATLGKNKLVEKLRCTDSKNKIELPSLKQAIVAKSHYFVLTYRNEKGERLKDEVYNYLGVNITAVLKAKDPVRKILVFVNGYRPTSLGSGLQQHFYDIRKNGFEFPDSYNRLYNFDRYLYWQPWNNIDQRFINVFLPTETYYADGHFSVSTSNYRSILNFSSASTQFPKRCAKGKPHHCFYVSSVKSKLFGARRKKSLNIINYRSNRSGFAERMKNGRVAGRNLYVALNELPNYSKNDTLFIVAHSMGFAYSLGMIEELRGKINFGSFIIIAPENAKAGKVNPGEWKEIWQYGSNLDGKYPDAPCLQDGVAPQSKVKGLPDENRIFIPKELYTHKGFFDSHFIGYYTWIFDLKSYQKGYIKKH